MWLTDMTTSSAICRTYLRTHIALGAPAYLTPDDMDDARDKVNAARPSEIRREMARILRAARHEWDKRDLTHAGRIINARRFLVPRWDDEVIAAHIDAAMSAAMGG